MYLAKRALALMAAGLAVCLILDLSVLVWCGIWVAIIALDTLSAPSAKLLEMERHVPARSRRTEPVDTTLTITSNARHPITVAVRDQWPPSAGAESPATKLALQPRQPQQVHTVLEPTHRGTLAAGPVTVRTRGLLRLAGRQNSRAVPASTLVTAPFRTRRLLPGKIRQMVALEGHQVSISRGAGSEFDSLREYVVGDDIRDIDWRATARVPHPMVRTWHPEKDRQLLIFNDFGRQSAVRIEDSTRFEAQAECAMLLSALATRGGDRVEYCEFAQQVGGSAQGNTADALLHAIGRLSANTQPNLLPTNYDCLIPAASKRLRHRSMIFLLTAADGAMAQTGLLQAATLLAAKHQVAIVSVAPQQRETSILDAGDALVSCARAEARLETARAIRVLRERGVLSVSAPAQAAAAAAADIYLEFKRRS